MKRVLLLLWVTTAMVSAQTASVTVDANGNVLNFSTSVKSVNYPTGKLTVNGIQITGLETDASTTAKGVTKLSVAPISPTNPIATGDNDPRNTNARTPTAHASSHASVGSDPVTLLISQTAGLQSALDLKAPLASPVFTGIPLAPTAAVDTNTTQLATTGFVLAQAANVTPIVSGTGVIGTSTRYARQDHVHPAQTSVTGNAGTATALQTARTINGVSFDGTANITLSADVSDTAFASSWDTVTTIAPSKNALYDYLHSFDTDDDGKINVLDQVAGIPLTDANGVLLSPIIDNSANWNTAYTQRVMTLSLTTPNVLYVTPVMFSDTGGAWTGTLTFNTQSANTVFAGPATGVAATPTMRSLVAADIPTLNQDTAGSAAKWTTARTLAGNSVDGSVNVPFANKFIVQGTTDAGLSAAQFLGGLATGIVKNTTTTGVLSIAVAGDFPTLNQSTTGSAATLTTARSVYGNNFDGSAALGQVIASTYGGTGNGFTKFSGPTTSERTKTVRDASDTILELGGSYQPTGTWTNLILVTPTIGSPTFTGAVAGTPTWANNQAITLSTATQPNITSIGTLTSLSVSGDITTGTGGTGSIVRKLILNGGSGTAGGGELDFQANSVTGVAIGTENVIVGTGSNTKFTAYSSNSTYRLYGLTAGVVSSDASGNITSGGITGTGTNDNAATGNVGQYISASVIVGSATTLTTATPKTVTSISLTAGDWDVTAIGALTGASTGTEFDVAIGTTTNSLTGTVLGDTRCQTPTVSLTGADATLMIPAARVSISSTTTYYLIVQETFTVGSPAAYGRISARRVR